MKPDPEIVQTRETVGVSDEAKALCLTLPALVGFVGLGICEWLHIFGVTSQPVVLINTISVAGLTGIFTSLACFGIKIRSYRILACQIFNGLWLLLVLSVLGMIIYVRFLI
jgi:hypothetical protein